MATKNLVNDESGDAGDDNATASAEFLAGFEGAEEEVDLGEVAADAKGKKAAAPAPAPAAAEKSPAAAPAAAAPAPEKDEPGEPDPELDPFSQSPIVQKILARQTELEHELRTSKGRVSALQGQLTKLNNRSAPSPSPSPAAAPAPDKAPAPEPAPKTPRPERDKVRGELPEVAAAMDEQDQAMEELRTLLKERSAAPAAAPPPAPVPAKETPEDYQARQLGELDPDWIPKMNSDAWKLWLSTQPVNYRDEVLSTDQALTVAAALKKFDGFMSARQPQGSGDDPAAQRRQARQQRAVSPAGSGGKPPGVGKVMTEREAMVWQFEHPDQPPP